jgi:uncharacterized membrane protein
MNSTDRRVAFFLPLTLVVAALFFGLTTWASYARWANFQYRTFDLAYYVQGLWQLIHGRFQVSVENAPLLGNHVEPIIFLFAPLFLLFRHPMLFVVVQNIALAAMGPIGYAISRRLGFARLQATLLSVALLLTPAAGYVALHEFHPEALAAPFLLLLFLARLSNSLKWHILWFVAVLACKENMALLLIAYCAVQAVVERKRGWGELARWYLWPMAVAVAWFLVCVLIITPVFNAGTIDYFSLYNRLGTSPGDILRNAVIHPGRVIVLIFHALAHGNLVWALLFPWLFLPLLRPRWLLIAAPILAQHLLSWRSSEWTIYFHYAAPLIPLFWMAMAEALASIGNRWHSATAYGASSGEGQTPEKPSFGGVAGAPFSINRAPGLIPWLLLVGCLAGQVRWGPAPAIASATADWFSNQPDRARKAAFLAEIPAGASVVAPFPYLSHLALRQNLFSLHYILKGLRTLSRQTYQPPPPTDFVFIDYSDSATFDPDAGYYHPVMKTADGRVIPSSDQLLHDFLEKADWSTDSKDALTLMRKRDRAPAEAPDLPATDGGAIPVATNTELIGIQVHGHVLSRTEPCQIDLAWRFTGARAIFPWMLLQLRNGRGAAFVTKGLCAPAAGEGTWKESWRLTRPDRLAPGVYTLEAVFINNAKRAWFERTGGGDLGATVLCSPLVIGRIRVE